MYFPNRLELLLLTVFAFPNPSRIGFELSMRSLTRTTSALLPDTPLMYCMMNFEVSVLPVCENSIGNKEQQNPQRGNAEGESQAGIAASIHERTVPRWTDPIRILH